MTTMTTTTDLLTDEMLARFDARAATYDRENRFFDEDWDELRQSGYLLAAVPTEFGGAGLGLDEVSKLQSRLAYYAPATAVAVNMHIYWTGVAADLLRAGDTSCRWMLERAASGEVFAAQCWRLHHCCRTCKGNNADPHMARKLGQKGFSGVLGRHQPIRQHIGGAHAARDVHGQHDGLLV